MGISMSKKAPIDDPIYEMLFRDKMKQYIEVAREWYKGSYSFRETGVFDLQLDAAPGLTVKFSKAEGQSPIKGIQMFLFVPVTYLQLPPCPGGIRYTVRYIVKDAYDWDEFTLFAKAGLINTNPQSLNVCIVRTDDLNKRALGRWFYFNENMLRELAAGLCTTELRDKAQLALVEGGKTILYI